MRYGIVAILAGNFIACSFGSYVISVFFFYFALFCTTALNFCSVIAQKCRNKNYSTSPAWKRKNKPNHTRNESH